MSWDISIQKFSQHYVSISEIPEDDVPLEIGSRAYVHEQVLKFFPNTNWTDPAWGVWDSTFGSIEFNLGMDDPADEMMLHVRASHEVVPGIVSLCLSSGWQGIDCSSGDFIEQSEAPELGLATWLNYRNQVIPKQDA